MYIYITKAMILSLLMSGGGVGVFAPTEVFPEPRFAGPLVRRINDLCKYLDSLYKGLIFLRKLHDLKFVYLQGKIVMING